MGKDSLVLLLSLSAVLCFLNNLIRKDSVEIADGYKTRIGEKLCDNLKDLQSVSVRIKGASAYVKFTSDPDEAGSGFKATYQALEKRASKCKPNLPYSVSLTTEKPKVRKTVMVFPVVDIPSASRVFHRLFRFPSLSLQN